MKIKSSLLAVLFVGLSAAASAHSAVFTPDVTVEGLYAAHKVGQGPFFQTNNRALAGKYFAKAQAGGDQVDNIRGELQAGETESVVLYVGEESGDYAAYCFANGSEAGRAILAACKNGERCEFSGEVDYSVGCKVPGLEADLSASGRILKVRSVKSLGPGPTGPRAEGRPHTPAPQTAERKAIAHALRAPVEKELKKRVVFKIDHLKVLDGWAFLRGVPQRPDGKPMDYRDTSYRRQKELGMFDDQISALLRQKGERWVVVTYNIGATDVVYLDWPEKHKAPPAIFE
jgi:hypothetical protein